MTAQHGDEMTAALMRATNRALQAACKGGSVEVVEAIAGLEDEIMRREAEGEAGEARSNSQSSGTATDPLDWQMALDISAQRSVYCPLSCCAASDAIFARYFVFSP